MTLPLLDRTSESSFCRFTPADGAAVSLVPAVGIPARPPAAGEQYRFHFDMSKCIGCKCCEVACSEQNNNPGGIRWRRVGELEGGVYPFAERFHLSMGCNHCLDAACLKGCPVDAYRKDELTGLVLHNANTCIGCQYCTWNCPYGVPQFNPERGVVGKCDMCHGRLAEGREPACVSACPQGAIAVELVNIAEWRATAAAEANAPGLPPSSITLSTTRITKPERMAESLRKADYHRVRPEPAHWPLIFFLVLTQMSAGAYTAFAAGARFGTGEIIAATVAGHLALGCSLLHLGRPIHAIRALKMWRRSWLSREVLFFSLFAGVTAMIPPAHISGLLDSTLLLRLASTAGLAGVFSSARIYMVPARPSWNHWWTLAEFGLTGALLGALLCGAPWFAIPAAAVIGAVSAVKVLTLTTSPEFEERQSAGLLLRTQRVPFVWRHLLLAAACIPLVPPPAAVALALAGEILGRWLFFTTVVPRNMAATFFPEAA